ncbi:hypothetical protein [Pleomorphovibrio marinus]|uniref:hypothetical protein n=1 Tax=Pleomorphovibrio marinus TaxID=2164132 RepID=UPI000E09F497|nr:hypothetical protein [Pleomorphovibrio marinus]
MEENNGEVSQLKKEFRVLERKVLLLIAFPLPIFSFVYLSVSNGSSIISTVWPPFINILILLLVIALLIGQLLRFNNRVQSIKNANLDLFNRVQLLGKATLERFWILFWVGILTALGLMMFENPGFTIAYAITLVFVSLGKPTPDRIIYQLKLKKEERDKVQQINRRDD